MHLIFLASGVQLSHKLDDLTWIRNYILAQQSKNDCPTSSSMSLISYYVRTYWSMTEYRKKYKQIYKIVTLLMLNVTVSNVILKRFSITLQ